MAVNNESEMRMSNIGLMNAENGFDIVIVCTSDVSQETYWQSRLEATRGQIMPESSVVLAVYEDWVGGAGNGLGTLYAVEKAIQKATAMGVDLMSELSGGASVALFHTAGKGTRLAPLPGSELNNKPGVKLPSIVMVDGQAQQLTILEAVIRQTGIYAKSRAGRFVVLL